MKLKNNLPVLMAKHGYKSLKKLAAATGITYFRLRQFANQDNKTMDYGIIETLCQTFDCEVADLFYLGEEEDKPSKEVMK